MFNQRHLFIIGAGASVPYSYPTGSDLKTEAVNILEAGNGDEITFLAKIASDYELEPKDLLEFGKLLKRSEHDTSIDAVIRAYSDPRRGVDIEKMVMAAKLVTAILIIRREGTEELDRVDENWYKSLFDKLYETSNTLEGFLKFGERLAFVTFNYDRSLEKAMLMFLCQRFELEEEEGVGLLNEHFQFIHPHGRVGTLLDRDPSTFREYDADWKNPDSISKATRSLKFITESLTEEDNETFDKIKTLIRNHDKVHFIGFGYNQDNMSRLGFDRTFVESIGFNKIYGTLKGKTPQQRRIISESYKLTLTSALASLPNDFKGDTEGALAYTLRAPFN